MERNVKAALLLDLGKMGYNECLSWQHRIHSARREKKIEDCLVLVEHPEVFTLGRRGGRENILVSQAMLAERNIDCVQVERGGDITYHGPGQLVGYPIFAVAEAARGVSEFVQMLESVMLAVLAECGLQGQRRDLNRGAWIGDEKVGFIGIAVRRGVSFHGFSLNITTDLSAFAMINPCGLTDTRVTSVHEKSGQPIGMDVAREMVRRQFETVFERELTAIDAKEMAHRMEA